MNLFTSNVYNAGKNTITRGEKTYQNIKHVDRPYDEFIEESVGNGFYYFSKDVDKYKFLGTITGVQKNDIKSKRVDFSKRILSINVTTDDSDYQTPDNIYRSEIASAGGKKTKKSKRKNARRKASTRRHRRR
jgi:hypothetical protein